VNRVSIKTCELCQRENVVTTKHHLTPREEGGHHLPTAQLCIPCHKQIHALYTNQELALIYNSIDTLKQSERVQRFIKWIQKQPATSLVKIKRSNEKTQKKKRY